MRMKKANRALEDGVNHTWWLLEELVFVSVPCHTMKLSE
jgi:hypothetical protein